MLKGIHMLGSESWGDAGWTKQPSQDHHSTDDLSLCQFLYALRSLVRTSYAACLITVPAQLFQVLVYHRRVIFIGDPPIIVTIWNVVFANKSRKL